MTRLLAIDTSSWWGGIALLEAEPRSGVSVVAEAGAVVRQTHSVFLLDWVDELLARVGWQKQGLDAFAAIRGPGSFTGIRIGLGTIRGLAMAADRPALGIGTLESVAAAYGAIPRPRHVVLDAGRGEVYRQEFDGPSDPPCARAPAEAVPPLQAVERALSEEAWMICQPPDAGFLGLDPGQEVPVRVGAPRNLAAAAGRIALALLEGSEQGHADTLTPLYVRPPDAVAKPRW